MRIDPRRRQTLAFMQSCNVIPCPVNALAVLKPWQRARPGPLPLDCATTCNLTSLPGEVVRDGTSPEGLPIGGQVVARPCEEDIVPAVLQPLESDPEGFQARDSLSEAGFRSSGADPGYCWRHALMRNTSACQAAIACPAGIDPKWLSGSSL